jgi:hypothetical protein
MSCLGARALPMGRGLFTYYTILNFVRPLITSAVHLKVVCRKSAPVHRVVYGFTTTQTVYM